MRSETYARACELDDDLPLDVCPGCGRVIDGSSERHYTPAGFEASVNRRHRRAESMTPWVHSVTSMVNPDELCEWTWDHLVARQQRRLWRLEYEAAHA